MKEFNIADLVTLAAVIVIMLVCIRNLTVRKAKGGCCGCSSKSCSCCALASQRKQ